MPFLDSWGLLGLATKMRVSKLSLQNNVPELRGNSAKAFEYSEPIYVDESLSSKPGTTMPSGQDRFDLGPSAECPFSLGIFFFHNPIFTVYGGLAFSMTLISVWTHLQKVIVFIRKLSCF